MAQSAVPVTTNLLVNLNSDSTDNFVQSADTVPLVQLWKDLAEDGTDASQQDYGQPNTPQQPGLLTNFAVPNSLSTGLTYNVLDFDRSLTLNNTVSSGPNSDVLRSKTPDTARPANYGDAFTSGADPAYTAANAAAGMSWFMVFRSTDNSVINDNNGNPGTTATNRWGHQAFLNSTYENGEIAGGGNNYWGTFAADGADDDTQVNMLNHMRDNAGNEVDQPDESIGNGTTANMSISTWYMAANSYDPVNGVFHSVVTTPDGSGGVTTLVDLTTTNAAMMNANGIGNGQAHLLSTLGQLTSANATRLWSFDGLMAEVLIYNVALDATDFDSVASYLNTKYFVSTVLPGDFNGDGFVDAADYVSWRKDEAGHGGNDGYLEWRQNFDPGTGGGSALVASQIPEPGSLALAIAMILGIAGGFRPSRFQLPRATR
ncbi:MAG: hypothetical protein WD468_12810 [Pirellulales bacterium]